MNKGNMKIIQINTHELRKTQFVFYFLPYGAIKKNTGNWEGLRKHTSNPYDSTEFALANFCALYTKEKLPTKVKALDKFPLREGGMLSCKILSIGCGQ